MFLPAQLLLHRRLPATAPPPTTTTHTSRRNRKHHARTNPTTPKRYSGPSKILQQRNPGLHDIPPTTDVEGDTPMRDPPQLEGTDNMGHRQKGDSYSNPTSINSTPIPKGDGYSNLASLACTPATGTNCTPLGAPQQHPSLRTKGESYTNPASINSSPGNPHPKPPQNEELRTRHKGKGKASTESTPHPKNSHKGIVQEFKRYEKRHHGAEKPWLGRRNIRQRRDRRGLREDPTPRPVTKKPNCTLCGNLHMSPCRYEPKDGCGICDRFHFGRCWEEKGVHRPLISPPPQPPPASGANAVPVTVPVTHTPSPLSAPRAPPPPPPPPHAPGAKTPTPIYQHDLIITGPGIWALSEEDARRRAKWQAFYNDALKGLEIEVVKVTLDPRFPMERKIRCRTEKTVEDTKSAILNRLRTDPGIDSVWEQEDYAEVVIHGVTVPRGYTVASLGAELRTALENLNPGKLGPRNPVFLAAPMSKTDKATLRVSLLTPETTTLKAPTPSGIRELECYPYVRNRRTGRIRKAT